MADTKESLVAYFSGLPLGTLQKLKGYSELLIIPEDDLLTNATMIQMVDKAHLLADSLFPEWTDRSKSDFGEFLVELFGLFSEKDFWYINAFANESILRKARSYSNVFSQVSALGYTPVLCKGSVATFSVSFAAGNPVIYQRGDLTILVGDIPFTNDEAFEVPADATTTTLQLHAGKFNAEDITFNGNNIFLRQKNIDIDSIFVQIDNIQYTRVGTFGNSGADSTHFMVLPEEDGSVSIYFGHDGFGIQPELGKGIHVDYRTCDGPNQDFAFPTTMEVKSGDDLAERPVTAVTVTTAGTGGSYAESLTSIREKAPLMIGTQGAAVNTTVTKKLLDSLSFIKRSYVEVSGQTLSYKAIPLSGGDDLSSNEQAQVADFLNPRLMMGYSATYTPNSYVDLLRVASTQGVATAIILDIVYLRGYKTSVIEGNVKQIIQDVTNPLVKADYGSGFDLTSVDVLIRSSVPGVQSVSFKALVGNAEVPMQSYVMPAGSIFKKLSESVITCRFNAI